MGLSRRHADLLEARGLDIELLDRLGVGSSTKLGADTIQIPYHRDDCIVGVKYRTISGDKRFSQEPGSAQIFYNRNVLSDETLAHLPIVICEGEVDCWSAIQAGFPRSVSVPAGAPAIEVKDRASAKYGFIDDMPTIAANSQIILAVDADDAGSALRADLALRLGAGRCRWVKYPVGCKDLNDALQRYGERGVVETLNRAQEIIGNVYRMCDIPPVAASEPYDSGFPGLSDHYRLRLGDFCVVTGIPGMGKTTFVNDLACRMAMRRKWPVCFASFEQIATIDQRRAMRTWYGAAPVKDLEAETVRQADDWIDKNFAFVVPDEESYPTVPWVLDRFAAAALRFGSRLFILDPFNELEHDRPQNLSLTEYVGVCLRDIKAFARKYEAHFILVCHPTKLRRGENGLYPIPTLYDCSDSAHYANKCDVGVVVHRETDPKTEDEKTLVRILKSRFHTEIGVPGDVYVKYDWRRATYDAIGSYRDRGDNC